VLIPKHCSGRARSADRDQRRPIGQARVVTTAATHDRRWGQHREKSSSIAQLSHREHRADRFPLPSLPWYRALSRSRCRKTAASPGAESTPRIVSRRHMSISPPHRAAPTLWSAREPAHARLESNGYRLQPGSTIPALPDSSHTSTPCPVSTLLPRAIAIPQAREASAGPAPANVGPALVAGPLCRRARPTPMGRRPQSRVR